jgi:hypothetical protein
VTGYRQFRFWSADLDSEAVRLSMADRQGREYYAIVASATGKGWRARRDAALDAIDGAITAGDEPGEVRVGEQHEAA